MKKIYYMKDDKENKLLPFQFYNLYNFVTMPIQENKKIPMIPKWSSIDKTIHPNYLEENIAILCGKVSNLVVLDIDKEDNGIKLWDSLGYKDIKTPQVKSPSGLHIYFRYTDKLPIMNRILVDGKKIGWDIRTDRSIVLCEPSTIDNKKYKFRKGYSLLDYNIQKMPTTLIAYILDHLKESTKKKMKNSTVKY